MGNEYMDLPFEFDEKGIDEQTGIFGGYASTFGGKPDAYRDVIVKGAFKKTLEKGGATGFGVQMLWQHKSDSPIGTWLELLEDSKGLKVQGKLTKGVRQADEALLLMKDKALQGMSIGYSVMVKEYNEDEEIRYLKEIDLYEISPVTFPANLNARITNVKAIEQATTEREIERALRDAGLSQKEALIMVNRCKPYLREIRDKRTLKDVLSVLQAQNIIHEAQRILN